MSGTSARWLLLGCQRRQLLAAALSPVSEMDFLSDLL